MSKSKDFMSALNRIIDAFDGTVDNNANDDILTALDNIADAIENSSKGGGYTSNDYIVTLSSTYNEQTDEYTYTVDKTNQEIYDAAVDGKNVRMVYYDEDTLRVFTISLCQASISDAYFAYIRTEEPNSGSTVPASCMSVRVYMLADDQYVKVAYTSWQVTLDN